MKHELKAKRMSAVAALKLITKYQLPIFRGCSSIGRAPALQAGGHRFDPGQLHHFRQIATGN